MLSLTTEGTLDGEEIQRLDLEEDRTWTDSTRGVFFGHTMRRQGLEKLLTTGTKKRQRKTEMKT